MSTTTPYLSLVIPAYNEEQRITATLEAVYAYLTRQPFTWELLVVIDGARDDTIGKVRAFGAGKEQIRWIERAENRGKGYTVREGMLAARGQVRLFSDADNSTDITHFDLMQPLLRAGYDVTICSRDPKDAPGAAQVAPQPFMKRVLGNLGNLFIQLMVVPGIWDTQCGFKAFSARAAERIFGVAQVDGWAFDIEALALARRLGYRTAVVPANWVDQPDTHVKSGDYLKVLVDTLRVRWKLWTNVYGLRRAHQPQRPNAS